MEKLRAGGFVKVRVLSRAALGYEDLKPYPLYEMGVLDQLFSAIAPEWRDKLVGCVTVKAVKPAASLRKGVKRHG